MSFLCYFLVFIGIKALVEPLTYVFVGRLYRENPEAEKTYLFEHLDRVYKRKYAKAISVCIGIICFISAIIVFNLYVSPTF